MTPPPVSVVIVSRDRPEELRRCLRALAFQTHRNFEVVVVGNRRSMDALQDHDAIKRAGLEEPNIAKSRNIGIDLSAGEVIAFIDDDAIAEPTWLARLIAPLMQPNVAASGGFVRGRNGISYQWQAETVGVDGQSTPLDVTTPTTLTATPGRSIKTHGTNCAFRAAVLRDLGGFDEAFHFYLDETDLNVRLGQAGHATAIVPDAEVQHGYAASALRGPDRRPLSLTQIAASQGHFLHKNGQPPEQAAPFRRDQLRRLDRALVAGLIEPRDLRRLRAELDAGLTTGRTRTQALRQSWPAPPPFAPFVTAAALPPHRFLNARWLQRRRAFAQAAASAKGGIPTTVIVLGATSLFHRRWFHPDGFWVQSGGIFGKSTRSDRLFTLYTWQDRVTREQRQLARTR